jgi:hypothetical protein
MNESPQRKFTENCHRLPSSTMPTTPKVPLIGSERNWASAVGLFLLNFGHLEFLVFDLLEERLRPDEFETIRKQHLADRVERLRTLLVANEAERKEFEEFAQALTPVRELRNHIAHGYFSITLRPGSTEPLVGITQAKDLKVCFSESTLVITFDQLCQHLTALTGVIERFSRLAENCPRKRDCREATRDSRASDGSSVSIRSYPSLSAVRHPDNRSRFTDHRGAAAPPPFSPFPPVKLDWVWSSRSPDNE